ncbi:MAG: SPOR domain-containing protein [Macellibacteroides fermentans]|uniref:SPOR domain-containing protein n=1 Tax=Macellibacteroides fermentans TaxID=879969 RepID=UPI003ACF47BB
MKDRYDAVNKYSTIENRLLIDNNDLLLNASSPKNDNRNYDNSVDLQLHQSQTNTGEYKVLYDDSEIVNGDIYKEAAAHRQTLISKGYNKDCNCNTTATTKGTGAHTSEFSAMLTDIDKKSTRKVGISFVDENDRSLMKNYSVVIASFYQPEKMASLKKALTSSSDKLLFVKNDSGVYYAIFGSYKTENEAQQRVKRITMEYTNLFTPEQLNDKYGITFSELYILKR